LKTIKGEVERSPDKNTSDEAVLKVIKKTKEGILETNPLSPEIAILDAYLPKPLTLDEMDKIIEQVRAYYPDKGMKDYGFLMKEVGLVFAGRGDMKYAAPRLKEVLST
jgi:hypothetical protein